MSKITIHGDPDTANAVRVTLDGDTVWLTQALRQHPLQGYTLNRQRLAERGSTRRGSPSPPCRC